MLTIRRSLAEPQECRGLAPAILTHDGLYFDFDKAVPEANNLNGLKPRRDNGLVPFKKNGALDQNHSLTDSTVTRAYTWRSRLRGLETCPKKHTRTYISKTLQNRGHCRLHLEEDPKHHQSGDKGSSLFGLRGRF